jgi:hypothetical protein
LKVLSFSVRSELAERLRVEAAAAGISLNQLLRNILETRDSRIDWAKPFPRKKGVLEEFFS